jgi:hypothetical protein
MTLVATGGFTAALLIIVGLLGLWILKTRPAIPSVPGEHLDKSAAAPE